MQKALIGSTAFVLALALFLAPVILTAARVPTAEAQVSDQDERRRTRAMETIADELTRIRRHMERCDD